MFKKILSGTVAALTIGGALMATATPAAAQWRGQTTHANAQYQSRDYGRGDYGRGDYGRGGYGRGDYDRHRNNNGAVLGAGILGLVIGAALTSDHNRDYAPQPTYYAPGYNYAPSYNSGCTTYSRWDPRFGRYVEESRCD